MINTDHLQEILAGEVEILEKLVEIEEKTGNILLEGDAKALHSLNSQKEGLIQKLSEAEKQRKSIYKSNLTLKEYISKEKIRETGELERLRRCLLQLQKSLQRQQKINRNLLNHNLRFLEYVLNRFFPQGGGSHYVSSGELKQNYFSSGLLDSNA